MAAIRRITTADPLYAQERDLREEVLLAPIGYDLPRFLRDFPGLEEKFEHFVAVVPHPSGDRVVGCATLLPNHPNPGSGRLMQMAVNPQRQGEGIGTRLVVAVECRALGELGLRELFCHAQIVAAPFYERLGWVPDGDKFMEAGIPHLRMVLRPPPEPADETP